MLAQISSFSEMSTNITFKGSELILKHKNTELIHAI
jgi:hypothetical protein